MCRQSPEVSSPRGAGDGEPLPPRDEGAAQLPDLRRLTFDRTSFAVFGRPARPDRRRLLSGFCWSTRGLRPRCLPTDEVTLTRLRFTSIGMAGFRGDLHPHQGLCHAGRTEKKNRKPRSLRFFFSCSRSHARRDPRHGGVSACSSARSSARRSRDRPGGDGRSSARDRAAAPATGRASRRCVQWRTAP